MCVLSCAGGGGDVPSFARQIGTFRRRPHAIYALKAQPVGPQPPDLSSYLQGLSWMAPTVPAADPTLIVDAGDLDVSGTFRAIAGSDTAPAFDAFAATSSEGAMALHYEATNTSTTASGRWFLTVRGATVITVAENFPTSSAALQWRAGDDVTWRAWYRPSTGQAGVRITVNGVTAPDTLVGTTGGGLAAPTAVSANGAPSSVADSTQWQVFIARHKAQLPAALTPEIIVLGDSTLGSFWYQALQGPNTGSWANLVSVAHDVYTTSTDPGTNFTTQRAERPGIGLLAVPSDIVEGQKSKFLASPWSSQSTVKAAIVQVGINNGEFLGDSAATVSAKVQDLVNTIRTSLPSCKILVSKLVPYTLYDPAAAASFLLPFNDDTMGTGANPITGVDGRISAHYAALDNGSGGYQAIYNFDQIHENNAGRALVAAAYKAALQGVGVLP